MHFQTLLAVLAATAAPALAHYNFESLILAGAPTSPYQYVRRTSNSNSPITSVSSPDLRCNAGGSSGASTATATVAAGSTIGFTVNGAISHPGPLMVYMSRAPGLAKEYDGSGSWFKIYQQGPKSFGAQGVSWKSDGVGRFEFVLPASVPAGEYLVRAEHIGLHAAQAVGGAQFYLGCAQVKVTGSGSGSPSPLVKFPGAYGASDPGVLFQPYYPVPTSYTMPGPAVWSAAAAVNPTSKREHVRDFAVAE